MNEEKSSSDNAERAELAAKLKEAREYGGFSQEEVSTFLKIPRSALSLIESGQRKVDVIELKRLADLYNRSVDFFTGDDADVGSADEKVKHLARKVADLSDDDQAELERFADFLRSRKQSEGKKP